MNALVQLGDLLVDERKIKFNSYKLKAGADYFPGMGITYLDEENIPMLLLPPSVSTSLKISLLLFAIFNYCKADTGAVYDPNLLEDVLVLTKEYLEVMYTMDCIHIVEGVWTLNESLESVVSIDTLEVLKDLEELI